MEINFKCLDCGAVFKSSSIMPVCSSCGGWVEVFCSKFQLVEFWQNFSRNGSFLDHSMWKFRHILPVNKESNIISMGSEGSSPLVHLKNLGKFIGHDRVFFRDERGGTGSFKDLAASVFISFLKEKGVETFVVASTGNIGTAYAAYAAKAGILMYVCIPEASSTQKADEVSAYGARVIRVKGDYAAAKRFAKELAEKNGWISDFSTRCPIRWEAKKTMAYDEFLSLGDLPDVYIQALSGGSGVLGYAKGARELMLAGKTAKQPRLFGIQAGGCAPMAKAFQKGVYDHYEIIENPDTSVATLATGDPKAYPRIAPVILESGGQIDSVPEESVVHAAVLLGRLEGILVEPATATAASGMLHAVKNGQIRPNETVVVNGGATIFRDIHFMQDINGSVNVAEKPEDVIFGRKTGEIRFEEAKEFFLQA